MPRALRDTLTFLLGAGTIVHEVVVTEGQRPYVLLIGATLAVGVPIALRIDEARRRASDLLDPDRSARDLAAAGTAPVTPAPNDAA